MAPPLFARRDPVTGHPRTSRFGGWLYPALALLARGRFLRGTMFDVFGFTKERRLERQLVDDFFALVLDPLVPSLNHRNGSDADKGAEPAQAHCGFGTQTE